MPETPEQFYARAVENLRTPAVEEWETWPFEGAVRPRALKPLTPEPAIAGAGGVNCRACSRPDDEYLWSNANWRLTALDPGGLPVVVILEPRAHYAGPADLPDDMAREQGAMLGRVERSVLAVGHIGKVHIGRWGEGAEHLHWWFIGRPEGFGQLRSSMAEIWDEVLPPVPDDVWQDNLRRVVAELARQEAAS